MIHIIISPNWRKKINILWHQKWNLNKRFSSWSFRILLLLIKWLWGFQIRSFLTRFWSFVIQDNVLKLGMKILRTYVLYDSIVCETKISSRLPLMQLNLANSCWLYWLLRVTCWKTLFYSCSSWMMTLWKPKNFWKVLWWILSYDLDLFKVTLYIVFVMFNFCNSFTFYSYIFLDRYFKRVLLHFKSIILKMWCGLKILRANCMKETFILVIHYLKLVMTWMFLLRKKPLGWSSM